MGNPDFFFTSQIFFVFSAFRKSKAEIRQNILLIRHDHKKYFCGMKTASKVPIVWYPVVLLLAVLPLFYK